MSVERAFQAAVLGLVLLGAFALSLSGRGIEVALASVPICIVNAVWQQDPHRRYLADWLATLICVAALLLTLGLLGGPDASPAQLYANVPNAGRLLLVVQWVMLFRRKTVRDYAWLCLLSFMLLTCTALLVPQVYFAAAFLLMFAFALGAMSLLRMRYEAERAGPAAAAAPGRPRRVGPGFAARHALAAVLLMAPTAGVFVLLPRGRPHRLPVSFQVVEASAPVVGFSDTVELGEMGPVLDNPTRVMEVRVRRDGRPAGFGEAPLMRGTAFDHYNGLSWTNTGGVESQAVSALYRDDFHWHLGEEDAQRVECEVWLEPINTRVLFAPFAVAQVSGLLETRRLRINPLADSVELARLPAQRIRYESVSVVCPPERRRRLIGLWGTGGYRPRLDPAAVYLGLPRGFPASVARLALEIAPPETYRTPMEVARRIEEYLFENYTYTLDVRRTPGVRDPVEDFLLYSKRGYCEHYASAMVLLLRCRGIPARLVAGFKGGTYNDVGGYFVFRQSDAHAWVEAYVLPYGWVTFDPTGPSESQRNPPVRRMRGLRDLLDYVRSAWMRRVVSYSYLEQSQVYARLRAAATRAWGAVRGLLLREREAPSAGFEVSVDPWRLGALALLLAAAVAAVRRLRRGKGRGAPRASARFYRRMERFFARRGLPRAPHVTPAEYAAALRERFPASAAVVALVTERFSAMRYAGLPLSREEEVSLEEAVAGLRRALRAAPRRADGAS